MEKGTSFTWDEYTNILRELKRKNYQFIGFGQAEQFLARNESFVLLRHDIDMDVSATLPMAYLEAEEGIQSTYFFLVCSDFYNIFSNESSKVLRELTRLGHTINVHFDCAIYPEISPANIRGYVWPEVKLFETWYNTKVDVISFHRPGNLELDNNIDLSPIRHTHEDIFFRKMDFCSDSRGIWRYGYPLESQTYITGGPMQLLVHPIWWNNVAEEVVSRLDRMLEDHTRFLGELVELNCTPYRERFVNQKARS
jgi:hypothetical protein